MAVVIYPAIVAGDAAEGYRARFPDLPGCEVSAPSGPTLLTIARDRLLASLKQLEAEGGEWPSPSSIERLANELASSPGVLILVDVQVEDAPVRVNISIGERLLRKVDETAASKNMSRSGFIAAACREQLSVKDSSRSEDIPHRLYEEVAAVGQRINDVLGPESTLGRALTDMDQRASEQVRKLLGGLGGKRNDAEQSNAEKAAGSDLGSA